MIDVAIVEDDKVAREGLAALIDDSDGFRCRMRYGAVEKLLAAQGEAPDVILLDIHLPGMSGTEAIPLVQRKYPRAAILMLTVFDQEDEIFRAICSGASGYLLKKTPPARLLEAIREAMGDGAPMSPEIARKVVRLFRDFRPAPQPAHGLTEQEVRLLSLLADGHSYESAGLQLGISINTVRNYIRRIYEALHVHSKSEAVSKALRQRII